MPDPNDHIRQKLREAREQAAMSQRELAERFGSAQVTISDLERGRTKVNAGDLVRLARILGKSVTYFLPGVEQTDLTDQEQTLISVFREFDDPWREQLLDEMASQLEFFQALQAVDHMPDGPEKAQAALEYQAKVWQADGVWVVRDGDGQPGIIGTPFPPDVNVLLTEGRFQEALAWLKRCDSEKHAEYAWVMLVGILHPNGVYALAPEGQPEVDHREIEDYLATKDDEHQALVGELMQMARPSLI